MSLNFRMFQIIAFSEDVYKESKTPGVVNFVNPKVKVDDPKSYSTGISPIKRVCSKWLGEVEHANPQKSSTTLWNM